MSLTIPQPIRLPQIDFVGGSTKTLTFAIYGAHEMPYDVSNCTANFSVSSFGDIGVPLISKPMTAGTGSETSNILTVDLESADTLSLSGKYLYQITIKDNSGIVTIPYQGNLYIFSNINRAYLNQ